MPNQDDLGSVVLPLKTTFVLPRNIARVVLLIGEKLVILDNTTGKYVKNDPSASAIANALFPSDPAKATAFLTAFVTDYNAYVDAALQDPGATPFFVP
jgi:hypothetical protein